MVAKEWRLTPALRYALSGQLQQCWSRECSEPRYYNGSCAPRTCTWTEHEWRDIPTEQPTQETRVVCTQCGGKKTFGGVPCSACNAMGESTVLNRRA